MNAGEKDEQETRPTGRAAQILHVAKTLAKLGDIINYSATKVDFKGFRAASLSTYHLKQDSVSERCVLCEPCQDNVQVRALGKRLRDIGDEIVTRGRGAVDCKGLKLAFVIIFSVCVYATLAAMLVKNSSI